MELKELRSFLAVAETLNFSRAAEKLFISQPTLSVRIKSLEDELNVKLLDRTRQRVLLTPQGSAILPAVQTIIEQADVIPQILREQNLFEPTKLSLKLGFDPTESRSNVRPIRIILNNLRKKHNHIALGTQTITSENYYPALAQGALDMAIVVLLENMPVPPDLLTIPLLSDPIVLISYRTDGMSMEEILYSRNIILYKNDYYAQWTSFYQKFIAQFAGKHTFEYVDNDTEMKRKLYYGNGVSFVPQSFLAQMEPENRFVQPLNLPNVVLTIIWSKYNLNPAVQLLINEAFSVLPRHQTRNVQNTDKFTT